MPGSFGEGEWTNVSANALHPNWARWMTKVAKTKLFNLADGRGQMVQPAARRQQHRSNTAMAGCEAGPTRSGRLVKQSCASAKLRHHR